MEEILDKEGKKIIKADIGEFVIALFKAIRDMDARIELIEKKIDNLEMNAFGKLSDIKIEPKETNTDVGCQKIIDGMNDPNTQLHMSLKKGE